MRTCRRIYVESVALIRRENDFCCLTSRLPSLLAREFRYGGLTLLSQDPLASGLQHVSMTIVLNPAEFVDQFSAQSGDSGTDRPWRCIFHIDELPSFCSLLLKYNKVRRGHFLQNATIHIDINAAWKGQPAEMNRNAIGLSRLRRLLDPLYQLHSFGAAQIEGPLSGDYKSSVVASLCKVCPTGLETIQTAMVILSQGDEQIGQNRPLQAVQLYKSALGYVRTCCWLYDERENIMNSGPFPGVTTRQAMHDFRVRLLARIASVYLDIGMLRMARVYVERAHCSRRFHYRRFTVLDPSRIADSEKSVYADIIHLSARIYFIHGNVREALGELDQARKLRPLDKEEQSRFDAWVKRDEFLHERYERRRHSIGKQWEREMKKTEGK